MKAFREWWNHLLCSNNENFRIVAESSWRAALKEVLKVCKQYEESWDHSISDWIKEELKND